MKLPIDHRRILLLIALLLGTISLSAQGLSSSNPAEYAAIIAGETRIDSQVVKQSRGMTAIAAEQMAMVKLNTKMKNWEKKYNEYLKTVSGYASAIKAATTLYSDGMQTLTALWDVHAACRINPQGIAASVSMNNLYMETASEFIRTYKTLKKVVAKGGEGNMLSGAERTELLGNLTDNLARLNRKLRLLAVSITMHSFEDVWNRAINGMIGKSNKMLAVESSKRMRRAMSNVAKFYRYRQSHKPWGQ